MGDWRVLKRWNVGDEYHHWGRGHRLHGVCDSLDCDRVVEAHQDLGEIAWEIWEAAKRKRMAELADIRMVVTVAPARPTFTVEVKFIATSSVEGAGGWSYKLTCDRVGPRGRRIDIKAYGFQSKDLAIEGAKFRADCLAKAMEPAETITYTPEF